MSSWTHLVADLGVIALLVAGIGRFRTPSGARFGNHAAALALAAAIGLVLYRNGVSDLGVVVGSSLVGAIFGVLVAFRVDMTGIPAVVAFQHGMGGVAAVLVSAVELERGGTAMVAASKVSGLVGLVIGAATFSASLLAAAKLGNHIKQAPTRLRGHNAYLVAFVVAITALCVLQWSSASPVAYIVAIVIVSTIFGVVFAIRIGGADMPVLISFLNATAGLAAAFCGVTIENRLLIVAGATVASSGSILTIMMCRAMNRSLANVFLGALGAKTPASKPAAEPAAAKAEVEPAKPAVEEASAKPAAEASPATKTADAATPVSTATTSEVVGKDAAASNAAAISEAPASTPSTDAPAQAASRDAIPREERLDAVAKLAREANKVIVVPGYGMALAHAQFEVVRLTKALEEMGKDVKFAIHPVAGRMPGHMNVLLAEAEVDYEKLCEMDDANVEFPTTDLVIVVGACDVVNPAAIDVEGTPLSGMPILMAHEARAIAVCNLDDRPGYSGVPNPMYQSERTWMLLGDALQTIQELHARLVAGADAPAASAAAT